MSSLDRKLFRDLWRMRGQVLAIALVMACGIATVVLSAGTLRSVLETRDAYYERYRFADVFAQAERAQQSLARRLASIHGVAGVETRIAQDVILDMPLVAEPVRGRVISLPEGRRPRLNDVALRSGRDLEPGATDEILVNEAFAIAHGLAPGDSLVANLNGHQRTLRIVGIALSPEFVYALAPGALVPDNRRFGVLWMGEEAAAAAFDLDGAFNDVSLSLTRGASEPAVIDAVDDLDRRGLRDADGGAAIAQPVMVGIAAIAAAGDLVHHEGAVAVGIVAAEGEIAAGARRRRGDDIGQQNFAGKNVLVLGAEGPGIRRLVKEHCDVLIRLPMHGPMPSINVSNAAAVAFHEFSKT